MMERSWELLYGLDVLGVFFWSLRFRIQGLAEHLRVQAPDSNS